MNYVTMRLGSAKFVKRPSSVLRPGPVLLGRHGALLSFRDLPSPALLFKL